MTPQRRVTRLVAVAACGLVGIAIPGSAAGDSHLQVERLAGPTRIETAVEISAATFEAADTVVVARSDDPADALAGAPLAASLQAPLLLVPPEGVPGVVTDELDRLEAEKVVLLGGTAALPTVLEGQFGGRDVRRLSGADRIETAVEVARALPASSVVYVAGVTGQVDALAAGAGPHRPAGPAGWTRRACGR